MEFGFDEQAIRAVSARIGEVGADGTDYLDRMAGHLKPRGNDGFAAVKAAAEALGRLTPQAQAVAERTTAIAKDIDASVNAHKDTDTGVGRRFDDPFGLKQNTGSVYPKDFVGPRIPGR